MSTTDLDIVAQRTKQLKEIGYWRSLHPVPFSVDSGYSKDEFTLKMIELIRTEPVRFPLP